MQNSRLKNSIVLKGMASNVVDEAIVILKPNIKVKKLEHAKSFKEKSNTKEFIVKEAEHVILEYVNKINHEAILKENKKLIKKTKKLQLINIMFFSILILLIVLINLNYI